MSNFSLASNKNSNRMYFEKFLLSTGVSRVRFHWYDKMKLFVAVDIFSVFAFSCFKPFFKMLLFSVLKYLPPLCSLLPFLVDYTATTRMAPYNFSPFFKKKIQPCLFASFLHAMTCHAM